MPLPLREGSNKVGSGVGGATRGRSCRLWGRLHVRGFFAGLAGGEWEWELVRHYSALDRRWNGVPVPEPVSDSGDGGVGRAQVGGEPQ